MRLYLLFLATSLSCAPGVQGSGEFEESEGTELTAGTEAPGVGLLGLELGRTRHAAVEAWLAERELRCEVGPTATRTSFRYLCDGRLPLSLLGDEVADQRGEPVLTRLLLVRPDDGPLHHLSTVRDHPSGESAAADYAHTVARITERLGQPDRSRPVTDPTAMSGPLVRYATDWKSPALEVNVSILRVNQGALTVQERWTVPTPEAQVERAEGRAPNPHLLVVDID